MDKNTTPGSDFTVQQQKLLVELVKTTDIQAACTAAGVGRTTAYRWLAQPAFADELATLRKGVMKEALETIKSLTTRAAQELSRLLDTEDERLRRQICKDILSHAIKMREIEGLERRITVLEKNYDLRERRMC